METFRVLVVDDELGIRVGVSRVLDSFLVHMPEIESEIQFCVEQSETAEEALELMQANAPDILLLDNRLPGMSGLEALERLGGMHLDVYPIVITAYASIETALRATQYGACDFLPKPFTPADLKSAIRKAAKQIVLQRRARELAIEKKNLRFELISMLAHELIVPLQAMDGYLKILRDRAGGNDLALYDEYVLRCINRNEYMHKMIRDLVELTRIESGQKSRDIQPQEVNAIARAAIDVIAPEAFERNVLITLHDTGQVLINADRAELEIILDNLLSNAVKYNRENGKVDVFLGRREDFVCIDVSDTGIGMTSEEAGKIFQDFVRIRNVHTEGILGSGLGLSAVRKLAEMYDGSVGVRSEPGRGSTFTVTLRDARPETGEGA